MMAKTPNEAMLIHIIVVGVGPTDAAIMQHIPLKANTIIADHFMTVLRGIDDLGALFVIASFPVVQRRSRRDRPTFLATSH